MPFLFSEICSLLSQLDAVETRLPPLLPEDRSARLRSIVEIWFNSHRRAINALDNKGTVALLSSLLPERRTDRVYGIQATGLCRTLSRCLHFSTHRAKDLQAYKEPGRGDLGECLERVLLTGGPPALPPVGLEEIDDLLLVLAGQCRFSDPSIPRLPPGSSVTRDACFSNIFRRLQPSEGKWLARLILKDFGSLRIDETLVLKSFHFMLPELLRFQQDFDAVVALLKGALHEYPERPDPRSERLLRQGAAALLRPAVGVKVGRPVFHKSRSVDHCLKMLGQQRWVIERKYDGEMCEIHIDLTGSRRPEHCIKIFSKSGKDSTLDRKGIHKTLIDCLHLGQPNCKIKRHAILLGELVVWSDKEKQILPFEEIRKHVTRSGTSLGTEKDDRVQPTEHLALVFFDILLLDDEIVMTKPVEERRQWLREVYTKIKGRALGAEWKIVDFTERDRGNKALVQQFAASIASRCEGLVLKPCGVPYFSLDTNTDDYRRSFIKMKKDYLEDMGDDADFAVVAASYNAQRAQKHCTKGTKWTDFILGALINKSAVLRFNARPIFKIVGVIQHEKCIPKPVLQLANLIGNLSASEWRADTQPKNFDLNLGIACRVDVVFDSPFVFEVLGSGFEKPSNCDFLMLRHARVKKLHQDRSWKDCVSFEELQAQGSASRAAPLESESQETRIHIEKLERSCRRKFERERIGGSQSNDQVTPSPCRRNSAVVVSEIQTSTPSEATYKFQGRRPLESLSKNVVVPHTPSPSTKPDALHTGVALCVQETPPRRKRAIGAEQHQNILEHTKRRRLLSPKCTTGHALWLGLSKGRNDGELPTGHPRGTSTCSDGQCVFANAVVYPSPCIASSPYIIEDLLDVHDTLIVSTLEHWDRDSWAYEPSSAVVGESQSYPDMRKIILVESRRVQAVKNVIQQLVELNRGKLRERVEVWDWRVLERCGRHDMDVDKLKTFFVGATYCADEAGGTIFVSTAPETCS